MSRFDDPFFQPPAGIAGADARAYEEKIMEMLRDSLLPSAGPVIVLDSIERRGERPDTEIVFNYHDTRRSSVRFAKRTLLWKDGWMFKESPNLVDRLYEAASVAGWIHSAWLADELEPVELTPPE